MNKDVFLFLLVLSLAVNAFSLLLNAAYSSLSHRCISSLDRALTIIEGELQ